MAREIYFKRLPDAATSDATRALEAYCNQKTGLVAYVTDKTHELRVRMWPKGRVLLTIRYQTRNEDFFGRAYCLPGAVTEIGIPSDRVIKPKHPKEPLRSEFHLTAEEYGQHLQAIAQAAAASFRNDTGAA
jgi:hypothetical protein